MLALVSSYSESGVANCVFCVGTLLRSWYVTPLFVTFCVVHAQSCWNWRPILAACEPVTYDDVTWALKLCEALWPYGLPRQPPLQPGQRSENAGVAGDTPSSLWRKYWKSLLAKAAPASKRSLLVTGAFQVACDRSEEHTSELQSRFGISYAVFCLKKK